MAVPSLYVLPAIINHQRAMTMTESELIQQLEEKMLKYWQKYDHKSMGHCLSKALQYLEQHGGVQVYTYVEDNNSTSTYVYISSNDSIRHHCMLNSSIETWLVKIAQPNKWRPLPAKPSYELYYRPDTVGTDNPSHKFEDRGTVDNAASLIATVSYKQT